MSPKTDADTRYSNGYDKTSTSPPPTQAGFTAPANLQGKAISKGSQWAFGGAFFPGPYDPSVCSIFAAAQVASNKAAAKAAHKSSYTPCNMFNAVYVLKNGAPLGTYCILFDTVLDASYAGFTGATWGGATWTISQSYSYSAKVFDQGRL